jgi:hypothetical protein
VACKSCGGAGVLGRGGYSKRNPLAVQRVIGARLLCAGVVQRQRGPKAWRQLQQCVAHVARPAPRPWV